MSPIRTKHINVADLIDAAADVTFVCRARLLGPSRLGMVSRVRKVIYYLGVKHGHSITAIGQRLGGKDHSSVSVGRKAAAALIETDADFAATVAEVEARAYAVAEDRKARVARMVPVELRAA